MSNGQLEPRRIVWLVARREVVTRIRSKAFKITTGLLVAAVVGGILAIEAFGGGAGESKSSVGFVAATGPLAQPLTAAGLAVDETVVASSVPDQTAGEQQVRDGDLDALVVGSPSSYQVVVDDELGTGLTTAFNVLARQQALDAEIVDLGGDPAEVGKAVGSAQVEVVAIDPDGGTDGQRLLLGMIAGILVYISLLFFGPAVSQGVIEEKASRVVELLLATVQPWQLMAGKVLGIGVVGLGQMVLISGVGIALSLATGTLDLPAGSALGVVAWSLVWYLLGFYLYALLFAAAGALVSRQEDAGGVTAPLIMLIIIPYVIGISVLPADPESAFVNILALVPFFAPLIMPMLVGIGGVAVWQTAVALVLTAVTIVGLVGLTGRIYGNAVKRGGTRVKITDALRAT